MSRVYYNLLKSAENYSLWMSNLFTITISALVTYRREEQNENDKSTRWQLSFRVEQNYSNERQNVIILFLCFTFLHSHNDRLYSYDVSLKWIVGDRQESWYVSR